MRVHLSRQVISLIYALREESAAITAVIELIKANPDQPDAIRRPGRPGRRELFVKVGTRGYWMIYEIDRRGAETEILIASVDEN